MRPKLLLPTMAAALLGVLSPAAAQTGPYIQMDLGLAVAPPLAVHGSNNDWGTKCDLLLNPRGLEVGSECDAAPPRAAWLNELGGASGIRTGFAVGYDWGAVRLEAEYFHRIAAYNERTDTGTETAVILAKRQQEIALAVSGVDDLRSHGVFANVYYDFGPETSSWTPYVGAGVGTERASLDYFSLWKRNHDPDLIATFVDPLLRATLAGTTSVAEARLTDSLPGYQLLAGVDYRLAEPRHAGREVPVGGFRGVRERAAPLEPAPQPRVGHRPRRADSLPGDDGRHALLGCEPQPEVPVLSFNQTGLRPEPPASACGDPAAPRRSRRGALCAASIRRGCAPNPRRPLAGTPQPRAAPAEARCARLGPFCHAESRSTAPGWPCRPRCSRCPPP